MTLKLTAKETAEILRKRHQAKVKAAAPAKFAQRAFSQERAKDPDDGGKAYMAWLHHDIPCIACLRLGRSAHPEIEAAHQKLQRADRGWNRTAGRRGPHRTCVPLCAGHHRLGNPCCDPAQSKFWSVLGFTVDDVIDFNQALNAAFDQGAPGVPVVVAFARKAAA